MLRKHLALAERHVAEGERLIARQRELVTSLERGGHDLRDAIELLRLFKELEALHVAHRDRLRKELGD
jgi:hypothetical protein